MDFVVAVDGTAASGKGTIAQTLATFFSLPYLDTGLLYRAVADAVLKMDADPDDARSAASAAKALNPADLTDPGLRSARVAEAASRVAAHPQVREVLLAFQQSFAGRPGGAVLDGRDIGTVIAPLAAAKLFIDASIDERARRRWLQTSARGELLDVQAVLQDLKQRDERDSARSTAPLVRAHDAVLIDTTNMSIREAADAACCIVEAARAQWLENQTLS